MPWPLTRPLYRLPRRRPPLTPPTPPCVVSQIAAWLGVAVLSSAAAFVYCFTHGAPRAAAAQPMLLYAALPLVLALPFDVLYAPSRFFFLTTLGRMLLPLQPISFPDFFVADVLTSMSKVLSDLERATCRMLNGQVRQEQHLACSQVSPHWPSRFLRGNELPKLGAW